MMQKPVLVLKDVSANVGPTGITPQVNLQPGQKPSFNSLARRAFMPQSRGGAEKWYQRLGAGAGLGGKLLAGAGAALGGMYGLADASQSGSGAGVLNAPIGVLANYGAMDPSGMFAGKQNAPPTYEGPAIANTESPDVGLATHEVGPSVMEAYLLAQEKQPPAPAPAPEPHFVPPGDDTNADSIIHDAKTKHHGTESGAPAHAPAAPAEPAPR